jgi:hypothetical protein
MSKPTELESTFHSAVALGPEASGRFRSTPTVEDPVDYFYGSTGCRTTGLRAMAQMTVESSLKVSC